MTQVETVQAKVEIGRDAIKVAGDVSHHRIGANEGRKYMTVRLTYETLDKFANVFTFKANQAKSKQGEQREAVERHVKKLLREMIEDRYTPQTFNISLNDEHLETLKIHEHEGGHIATFTATIANPLHVTDGSHRLKALAMMLMNAEKYAEQFAMDVEEFKAQINNLEIPLMIYLDGEPKLDFIRLQEGLKVDRTHLDSLRIQTKQYNENVQPQMQFAYNVIKKLNSHKDSFLYKRVGFDSTRGEGQIGFSSFTSKGGSEVARSLVGTSRICKQYGKNEDWAVGILNTVWQTLQEDAPELVEPGMMLCPPSEGGKVGAAQMLIGLANCLAFRVLVLENDEPTETDLNRLVAAAKAHLKQDTFVLGGPSNKRQLHGDFAKAFFNDIVKGKDKILNSYDGIPRPLLDHLSPSSFGIRGKIPAEESVAIPEAAPAGQGAPKKRGRPRKAG